VRLRAEGRDLCIANLHLTAGARRHAEREALRAGGTAVEWAGAAAPLIVGGDFNVRPRSTAVFDELERRNDLAAPTAPDALDHLLARDLEVIRAPSVWPVARRELQVHVGLEMRRLRLSDHAPVEATFGVR
jgi:endonuclease/exonuclease/phosphatase family metal-dependent hydrolase